MIEEQLQNLIAAQQEANRLLAFIANNFTKPEKTTPKTKAEKIEEKVSEIENSVKESSSSLEKQEEPPSIEDCRAALVEVSKKLGKSKAKELLGRFKAEKMGDVKEEDYLAFLNATKLSLEEA